MMRSIILFLLSCAPIWAASYTSTSACATSCNLSARASWSPDPGAGNYPGLTPANHDRITVASGHTVVVDASATLGSNAGGVGHAFTINATNSSTFGKLQVAAGVTLTLQGFDRSTNTMGLINQYAHFEPLAGSSILFAPPVGASSLILNNGVFLADATGGTQIYIGEVPACYSWATQVTNSVAGSNTAAFDNLRFGMPLIYPAISNAAGTGPGSFGDTSLSISSITNIPGGWTAPGTEVATLDQVLGPNQYWVNYDAGNIIGWGAISDNVQTITATYKHLKVNCGAGIYSVQNTDYNSFVTRNAEFQYLGEVAGNWAFGLDVENKTSVGVNATRVFEMTHCKFRNYSQFLLLYSLVGSAGSPLLLTDNDIGSSVVFGNDGNFLSLSAFGVSYLSVANNTLNNRTDLISTVSPAGSSNVNSTTTQPLTGWTILGNTGFCEGLLDSWSWANFPDLLISGNVLSSIGKAAGANGDAPTLLNLGVGTPGHLQVVTGNTFSHMMRALRISAYTTFSNNQIMWGLHHPITGAPTSPPYQQGVWIHDNVIAGTGPYDTSSTLGYITINWLDGAIIERNVSLINPGFLGFGGYDTISNGARFMGTGLVVRYNVEMLGAAAEQRPADVPGVYGRSNREQIVQDGPNLFYGNTANFTGYTRGGTFTQAGVAYNTSAARAVTGVALWNPSYPSLPSNNHTLTYTYTSATNIALALDAGAAQQIVWPSAGTSYTISSACSQGTGTSPCSYQAPLGGWGMLNAQGSPGWSVAFGDAAHPGNLWLVMTSGAAAGAVRMISVVNGAAQLGVTPDWDTGKVPANNDTFVIYSPQFSLSDGAGQTVEAAIDPRYIPASSQTDTGINISSTDLTATNPVLSNGNDPNGLGFWGYVPSIPTLWCAAPDGDSWGLSFCGKGKALIAVIQ